MVQTQNEHRRMLFSSPHSRRDPSKMTIREPCSADCSWGEREFSEFLDRKNVMDEQCLTNFRRANARYIADLKREEDVRYTDSFFASWDKYNRDLVAESGIDINQVPDYNRELMSNLISRNIDEFRSKNIASDYHIDRYERTLKNLFLPTENQNFSNEKKLDLELD